MEQYVGEIRMFAGNYAPQDWAFCEGQILNISEHQMLFAILGATYGGNGHTTFALPDLRGRVAVHRHNFDGLSLGKAGGKQQAVAAKSGDSQPTVSTQPFLAVNFIIALQGEWPPRGD